MALLGSHPNPPHQCLYPTDTNANQVDQYVAFIRASADDVVEQALAYVFAKDRASRSPQVPRIAAVSPTLRIRKPAANESAEQPARKTVFLA